MTSSGPPYQFEATEKFSVVSLLPGINDSRWGDIENVGNEILEKLSQSEQLSIIIDLSALQYMGSAVVALILRVWKASKEKQAQMVIVTHEEIVYEVLRIAGLTEIWSIAKNREQAERMLQEGLFTQEAAGSSMLLTYLGIFAVIGAGVGLFSLLNPDKFLNQKTTEILQFGFSSLGMITGTISAIRDRGIRRTIGILIILICLAISLAGLFLA